MPVSLGGVRAAVPRRSLSKPELIEAIAAEIDNGSLRNGAHFDMLSVSRNSCEVIPMFLALQVLTVILVAVAMALALAHALELPGKMRLSKEQYLGMQPIYYPGFAIGGIAEPVGLLMTLLLVLLTSVGSAAFWLTAGAFVALLVMHAAYWLLTHSVNNFWLKDFKMKGIGAGFFSFVPLNRTDDSRKLEWTLLRDRWEFSHVVRAGLGLVSLILLVTAVAA